MALVSMFLCNQSYASHGRDFLLWVTILNSSERMEKASNELELLKSAMSMMSPEVQNQVSMALARASAVPIRPSFAFGAGRP